MVTLRKETAGFNISRNHAGEDGTSSAKFAVRTSRNLCKTDDDDHDDDAAFSCLTVNSGKLNFRVLLLNRVVATRYDQGYDQGF